MTRAHLVPLLLGIGVVGLVLVTRSSKASSSPPSPPEPPPKIPPPERRPFRDLPVGAVVVVRDLDVRPFPKNTPLIGGDYVITSKEFQPDTIFGPSPTRYTGRSNRRAVVFDELDVMRAVQ